MEIEFSLKALQDLAYWKKSGNKKLRLKITDITNSILETPYLGIGKPEALKYGMSGLWSRRISQEDRCIYEIIDEMVIVHSLRGHYK